MPSNVHPKRFILLHSLINMRVLLKFTQKCADDVH